MSKTTAPTGGQPQNVYFAQGVLQGLAIQTGRPFPATASNLSMIERWINREGGGGANNPLNTTQQMGGSNPLAGNSAGVQNYPDIETGIEATVKTLLNGNYADILSALEAGNADEQDKAGALAHGLGKWSGGGYTTVANTHDGGGALPGGSASVGAGNGTQPLDLKAFAALNGIPPQWINDPQLGPLLQQWDNNQLSDQQFFAAAEQTKLWKTTPQSQRQLLANQATDPATAAQTLTNTASAVWTEANKLGVPLNAGQVSAIAAQALKDNWSQDQITQNIASHFTGGNNPTGEAAADAQQLRAAYKAYGLPVSPQKLTQQMQSILAGTQTTQDVVGQLVAQAKTLYAANPQLANFIDDSHTVRDWADPYLQHAANALGLNPNSIDLNRPMWQKVLSPYTDPTTGTPTGQAMTLDQWDQTLRTDPVYGFDTSQTGINAASSFTNELIAKMTGAGV